MIYVNELIFFCYIIAVSTFGLIAARMGKEALIALICVQCVLVNLFVTKEITLFGLTATASDALAVGTTLALNLLQEFFKRDIALRTIWISFFCAIFYVVISLLHLSYIPAITDLASPHFNALLYPMPRIIIASLVTYLIVQNIDCRLYGYLCKRFESHYFVVRNYTSVSITQFIDTVLFSFLGLYGINESFSKISTILQIITVSYSIKLLVILIAAPFLAISKKLIKHESV